MKAFLRPGQKRDASTVPPLELDDRLEGVVDVAAFLERPRARADRRDLADQVAGEVEHVRAEIPEGARACGGALETPDDVVDVAPLLQVAAAEVVDVAQVARLQQLARERTAGTKR